MAALTLNDIFNRLLDEKILRNTDGGYKFDRKEKLAAVFPSAVVDFVAARSLSYLTWFLNDDKRGDSVRAHVASLFDADPLGFIRVTVSKCSAFLANGNGGLLPDEVWEDLLVSLGKSNSLFIRDSKNALKLKEMVHASSSRVLTVLLMDASTGGLTQERYEKILSCWHLMDREMVTEDTSEPEKAARAGEILYADGNRKAAAQLFEKAVSMLKSKQCETEGDTAGKTLLRDLLFKLGSMYLRGDGGTVDREKATVYFEKSSTLGHADADYQLALIYRHEGFPEAAKEALIRGAQRNNAACLRMLGNSCFAGDDLAGGSRKLETAWNYFLQGACPENLLAGDPHCQFMLGRILEENERAGEIQSTLTGKEAEPEFWYEAAFRRGIYEAGVRLNRRRWHALGDLDISNLGHSSASETLSKGNQDRVLTKDGSSGSSEGSSLRNKYCILTSFDGGNRAFAESLPEGEYRLMICGATNYHEQAPFVNSCFNFSKDSPESPIKSNGGQIPGSIGSGTVTLHSESAASTFRALIESLPGYGMMQEESLYSDINNDAVMPQDQAWDAFPEIIFLALSDNEADNLRDGLQILSTAYLLHEKINRWMHRVYKDLSDDQKEKLFYLLSDRIKLFVLGKEEVAGPVFDSACSRMGDFYIPLLLCDRNKLTSMSLLEQMPLFLPCLQTGAKRIDTVIYGDHPGIVQLCKDSIAAAQIDDIPFSLTVVGENADLLEKKFRTECPGIAGASCGIPVCMPEFVKLQPESERLQELLSVDYFTRFDIKQENGDDKLAVALQSATYLVVYTKDADRNLTLAMFLREWYLKTDPSFCRLPFITAYCEKDDRAEQLRTLTAGAEEFGFSWFNNYEIENFGTEKSIFSFDALMHSRLENRALASHFSYYVKAEKNTSFYNCFEEENDRFHAEHDYYIRNYNRDSSLVNALAVPYRLFSAGIFFRDWHAYAARISQSQLADKFEDWLLAEGDSDLGRSRLEVLSIQEHGRWCRTMLSRGWKGASQEQMQTYIQRGCNRHQLYIAKLHPFLCSWDQLGDTDPEPSGIQKDYSLIMTQIHPGKAPANIRDIDRENVRKTAMLLREE